MPCQFLDKNNECFNNCPCPEWIEWESKHPDSESWEYCKSVEGK